MKIDGFTSTRLTDVITIRHIFTIHYFEYTSDFSFPGESHDFWEMCCVDNGAVEVDIPGGKHTLFKGDVIFHPPGEFHRLRAHGGTAPNILVLSFACSSPAITALASRTLRIAEHERRLMGRIIHEAREGFQPPLDDPMSLELVRRESGPFGWEQIIRIYLEELLINLIRLMHIETAPSHPDSPEIPPGTEESTFGKVLRYMIGNINRDMSVDDLCRAAGCSRSHLHNLFKACSGHSAAAYHRRLRVETAKRMIREGGRNFSEIAAAMNYSTLQHFSRVFKRCTGMTPREYAASSKLNSDFGGTRGRHFESKAAAPPGSLSEYPSD